MQGEGGGGRRVGGGGGVGGRACAPITPTWSQLPEQFDFHKIAISSYHHHKIIIYCPLNLRPGSPVRPLPSLFCATSRPSTTSPIAGDLLRQHLQHHLLDPDTQGYPCLDLSQCLYHIIISYISELIIHLFHGIATYQIATPNIPRKRRSPDKQGS